MKMLGYVCLLGVLNSQFIAMESKKPLKVSISEAVASIDKAHAQLFDMLTSKKRVSADLLVERARFNENFIVAVILQASSESKMEYLDGLIQKRLQTQKALMAFRLLQVYESNKFNKHFLLPLYKIGNVYGDVFGFAYLGLAALKCSQMDYKTSLFSGAFGMGAFFASCYCRHQKTKLVKRPIPSRKEIYDSEKNKMDLPAVESAMGPIELDPRNKYANALKQEEAASFILKIFNDSSALGHLKSEAQQQRITFLKKLRSLAFKDRDIDAILAITHLIENNTK